MTLGGKLLAKLTRIGLREKLLFSMLAAVLFISVAIALVSRYILVNSLTHELEMRGMAIAHSVAERGGSYILDDDVPQILTLIFDETRLRQRKHLVSYIFIEDQQGNILAHTLTHNLPTNLLGNNIPPGEQESVKLVSLDGQEIYDLAAAINEGLYRIGTVSRRSQQKPHRRPGGQAPRGLPRLHFSRHHHHHGHQFLVVKIHHQTGFRPDAPV